MWKNISQKNQSKFALGNAHWSHFEAIRLCRVCKRFSEKLRSIGMYGICFFVYFSISSVRKDFNSSPKSSYIRTTNESIRARNHTIVDTVHQIFVQCLVFMGIWGKFMVCPIKYSNENKCNWRYEINIILYFSFHKNA